MPRFVLRYQGGQPDRAAQEIGDAPDVQIVESAGRNLLVDADEKSLRAALDAAKESAPHEWILSPESSTSPPAPRHPILHQPRNPPTRKAK